MNYPFDGGPKSLDVIAFAKRGEIGKASPSRIALEASVEKITQAMRHGDGLSTTDRARLNAIITEINGVIESQMRRGRLSVAE